MVAAGLALGLACVDMSAPKGPASISLLQLPAGFVVAGDTMRDSTGAVARVSVIGYDANGAPMQPSQYTAQFFITDTGRAAVAHFNLAGLLIGDTLGQVHVVGQIGNLQTPVTPIYVTPLPTTITRVSPSPDTVAAPFSSDTTIAGGGKTTQLLVSVTGAGGANAGVQGLFVHYALVSAPPSASPNAPAVLLQNGQGMATTIDTTKAGGTSSLNLVVVTALLAPDTALLAGHKLDTAIVEARASYKGMPLQGSPVRFILPIQVQLKLP